MKTDYKQSLAFEEIAECIGSYNFSAVVVEDRETLSLLENSPFVIALKCTIKQGNKVLGIGRANSKLSPKNKFLKSAVLYCWNAAITDGISKTVKMLDDLPIKETSHKETEALIEEDLEGRDTQTYFNDEDTLKYASDKQKKFLEKLISSKCKGSQRSAYESKLASPYLSSFECSGIIKTLLSNK